MSRNSIIFSVLGVVVLVAAFWFLGYSPQRDEIADVRAQAQTTVDEQRLVEAQIAALEDVRAQIPEVEAAIAAAESVIPRSAALPSILRQLAEAADGSGVTLIAITPSRPVAAVAVDPTVELPPDLAAISLTLNITGGYFQVVDFLRRIEDPAIIARGIVWSQVDLSPDEYPTLSGVLNGQMYARIDAPLDPAAPTPTETPSDGATSTEAPTETPTAAAATQVSP